MDQNSKRKSSPNGGETIVGKKSSVLITKSFSNTTDIHHKPSRGSYQGVRHAKPSNTSPLRAMIERIPVTDEKTPMVASDTSVPEPSDSSIAAGGFIQRSDNNESQLKTLLKVNEMSRHERPFVFRPSSRYVSSILVRQ